jgi:hypothetical protein
MADAIDDALVVPAPPKSMSTAEGSAVQRSADELIALDQYQSLKLAAKNGFSFGGARIAQAVGPPQCDTGLTPNISNDAGGDGF